MKPFGRVVACVISALSASGAAAQDRAFVVAHSMIYKGGVDLTTYGIKYNPIIYESSLLPSKTSDEPASKEALKRLLDEVTPGPLPTVLDIERWPSSAASLAARGENVAKLVAALKLVRSVRPDLKYGFYGELPARVYWPLVDPKQGSQRLDWESANERSRKDFAPYVDAVFPSLYTFYNDERGWERYATSTLTEARRFNKPVYCYLWPQYHPSNATLSGQFVSAPFWRLQLDTCRKHADGIVIWGHMPMQAWNPEAPWWLQTIAFMRSEGLTPTR